MSLAIPTYDEMYYIKHNVSLKEYEMHKHVQSLEIVNIPKILAYDRDTQVMLMERVNNMNVSDYYGEKATNITPDLFQKIRTIIKTLYVKEENKWEKETQDTKQMLSAVRGVNKKNYQFLTTWKETHPKCMDSKSNQSDEYMKLVSKVMDGDEENINKVIKKVAKEVVIEKEK